ncbi:Serine palmitoyltransferase 2 [Venturia nashicola]|nr:Serine palmitoyltransferase 2 [Venturia nashicola]
MTDQTSPGRCPDKSPSKKPTSFLSLPCELRQQILFDASKPKFMDGIGSVVRRLGSLSRRVKLLREIDLQLNKDIDYVEKEWARRILKLERKEIDEVIWSASVREHLSNELSWYEKTMLEWAD